MNGPLYAIAGYKSCDRDILSVFSDFTFQSLRRSLSFDEQTRCLAAISYLRATIQTRKVHPRLEAGGSGAEEQRQVTTDREDGRTHRRVRRDITQYRGSYLSFGPASMLESSLLHCAASPTLLFLPLARVRHAKHAKGGLAWLSLSM